MARVQASGRENERALLQLETRVLVHHLLDYSHVSRPDSADVLSTNTKYEGSGQELKRSNSHGARPVY